MANSILLGCDMWLICQLGSCLRYVGDITDLISSKEPSVACIS
jgi:hypothetical protein